MLRFEAYIDGQKATDLDLTGAYAFGQDDIPVRADLVSYGHQITCMKQASGACGLAMLWNCGSHGQLVMTTTRLPERKEAYNLNLELARAQIMRLYRKREDWALFDYPDAAELNERFLEVRELFVQALCQNVTNPAQAAIAADGVLDKAIRVGEDMALFHANLLWKKRIYTQQSRLDFGVGINPAVNSTHYENLLHTGLDYICIPMSWRNTEPKERVHEFANLDHWINWAARNNKSVFAGPLLSFAPQHVPDWLEIWKNDFEALKKLIYSHIQRVVERYANNVDVWIASSGLEAINNFDLSFEQITELTRSCCQLINKIAPSSKIIINIPMPWGEYYARNQRTIPPMLFADLAYQADLKFDAFGIDLQLGIPTDGHFVRDLMQVSAVMDNFLPYGKPVHITAFNVPSSHTPDPNDYWNGRMPIRKGGSWHTPWTQKLQAEWLHAVVKLARSKPFIESVCWGELADLPRHFIPHGGLCGPKLEPKLALKEFRRLWKDMQTAPEPEPQLVEPGHAHHDPTAAADGHQPIAAPVDPEQSPADTPEAPAS